MKAYRGVKVQLHSFFTSALDGDEWLTSREGRLTPVEGDDGCAQGPFWKF